MYRRRRFVLLLAVALIATIVTLLIVRPWEDGAATPAKPAPGESTSVDASADPSASATPKPRKPGEVLACTKADVVVTAGTDQEEYGSGSNPKLSITLKNTSKYDCTIDVGTATQVFTISSGADIWWRSTDCQKNPTKQLATLKAGQETTTNPAIEWQRERSSVDTCSDEVRPVAPGGGASYHLAVSIGGIASESSVQFFLA